MGSDQDSWKRRDTMTRFSVDRDRGGWRVLDPVGGLVYAEIPSRQIARDVAWALNRGAVSDQDVLKLVVERDGRTPEWANWMTEVNGTPKRAKT
jgi:hypothetical protein